MGCLLLSFAFHPPSPRHQTKVMREAKYRLLVTHHASLVTFFKASCAAPVAAGVPGAVPFLGDVLVAPGSQNEAAPASVLLAGQARRDRETCPRPCPGVVHLHAA